MRMFIMGALLLSNAIACGSRQQPAHPPEISQTSISSPSPQQKSELKLTSSAFKEGEAIPRGYTCDGANVSPPLEWTGMPKTAKTIAIIADDPDAPAGTWVHWVVYNLPPDVHELPAQAGAVVSQPVV